MATNEIFSLLQQHPIQRHLDFISSLWSGGLTHIGFPRPVGVHHSPFRAGKESPGPPVYHRVARHHGGPCSSTPSPSTATTATAEAAALTPSGTFPGYVQADPSAEQASSHNGGKHAVHLLQDPAHAALRAAPRSGTAAASGSHRSRWGRRPITRLRPDTNLKHQPRTTAA